MQPICREAYQRPDGTILICSYLDGHPNPNHSWFAAKVQDDYEKAEQVDLPSDVETLVTNIQAGKADPYLEIILSVCHNRKRALRNVPGFRSINH